MAHADARVNHGDGDVFEFIHFAPGGLRLNMRQRPLAVVIGIIRRVVEGDADDEVLLDQLDIAIEAEVVAVMIGHIHHPDFSASMRSTRVRDEMTYSHFSSSGVLGS